jgi:hypothetical protein
MSDQVPDGVDWSALGAIHSAGRIAESTRHSKKARLKATRAWSQPKAKPPQAVRSYSKVVAAPVFVVSHFSKASLLSTTIMPADIEEWELPQSWAQLIW